VNLAPRTTLRGVDSLTKPSPSSSPIKPSSSSCGDSYDTTSPCGNSYDATSSCANYFHGVSCDANGDVIYGASPQGKGRKASSSVYYMQRQIN
jgi:hypothetical protein